MSLSDDFAAFEKLTDELFTIQRRRFDDLLAQFDLSRSQALALAIIHDLKETKMSPLAERLGLSPGAATTLVERLVEGGLVVRRRGEDDRRSVCVHLTARGEEIFARANEAKREMTWALFQLLPADARRHLLSAFEALYEANRRLDQTGGQPV